MARTATATAERGAPVATAGAGRMTVRPSYPIEVEHLTKRYGRHAVVNDLTFSVEPGRVTGFLGPNGSGKSTTMKVMLGLAAASEGTTTIGGQRYGELPDPTGTVGVLLEPNAFHPGRSGHDHLRILADAAGVAEPRVNEMLELVGLNSSAANRHAGTYSLGMKQRLSLAAALLTDPPVLILDEPSNGLDPQGIRTLRELLRARAADGDTVLVSSHLLAEVEHLVDDLVVIDRGKLITTGSMSGFKQAASLARTPEAERLRAVLEAAGAAVEREGDDALIVNGLPLEAIGEQAFAAGIALHELSPHAGSLEDLFLEWTSGEADDAERSRL